MISPFRYHRIQNEIHCGAHPTLKNYRFLQRLGFKTMISLLPEDPVNDLVEFCKFEKIIHCVYKVKAYKENVVLSSTIVNEILEKMIDVRNYPIYIHCLNGGNVTHQIIMCFRKLQTWTQSSISNEAIRYCDEIVKDEYEFVKGWDGEIRVPEGYLPAWLGELWWVGELVSHPTCRLLFATKKKRIKQNEKKSERGGNNVEYPPYIEQAWRRNDLLQFENSLLESLGLEIDRPMDDTNFSLALPSNVLSMLEHYTD